jgi:hypothetical protein
MAGSVPIKAGGKLYGDGMDDEFCAQKGIDAVIEDLKMM